LAMECYARVWTLASRGSGDFPQTGRLVRARYFEPGFAAITAQRTQLSPTEPMFSFGIEQNGHDWVVVRDGATVSVHSNREEAEHAVEWLVDHSVVGPQQAVLFGDLTPRELVVLERLNHRGSYNEIARELFVSTNTMKTHVRNVYAKLGVTNRGSALA